jgi:RNA polymerase sigma-70 factor (ECF subfamily)
MTTDVIDSKTQFPNLHHELIDLCKAGDQKAQFQIYKLYYKAMYNISLRIVNNPMEAEDIMQESFLSAFEKIDIYSGIVSFGAWLKRIVINRSLDVLKREKKVKFEDIESVNEIGTNNSDDLTLCEETESRVQEVKDSIRLLPDGCRIVISLYLLEGYDHEEIAEILSISPVTSRSQLSRAKQKIVANLINY